MEHHTTEKDEKVSNLKQIVENVSIIFEELAQQGRPEDK